MIDYQKIIDKYYPSGSRLRATLILHSTQVADKALKIAASKHLDLSEDDIKAAAMLHDIGIFKTHAPSIFCEGSEPYICHGILGAQLLRSEGVPEYIARVAERHTGAGLTLEDIENQQLPLPPGNYMPETMLEKLICYADKFFSKSGDMKEKSFDRVSRSMQAHGDDSLSRFMQLHHLFG